MRALLTTATAALTLCVLAGCGDASTPAASDQNSTTTTSSSTSAPPPSKTPPATPTPSDVAPPKPPAGKPQNPTSGEPLLTIEGGKVVVPPGVKELPASQVDASAVPQYGGELSGKAWLHEDGFTVETIAYASSGCTGAEAVVVDQAPGAVKIILRPLDQPLGGKPDDSICATVMTPRPVAVTLDQPLADRTVLLSAGR